MIYLTSLLLILWCASSLYAKGLAIHGSVSQSYVHSIDNNFVFSGTEGGSLNYSEAYINFTQQYDEQLRFGIQLAARSFGDEENFEPTVDWAYGDYRLHELLGIQVGSIKVPFGIYNEVRDIDFARPNILLDQGIYPESFRMALDSYTGGSLYGSLELSHSIFDYCLYMGATDIPDTYTSIQTVKTLYNAPNTTISDGYMGGSHLKMLIGDHLSLGHTYLFLQAYDNLESENLGRNFDQIESVNSEEATLIQATLDGPLSYTPHAHRFTMQVNIASVELRFEKLTLAAEYEYFTLKTFASDALVAKVIGIGQESPFIQYNPANLPPETIEVIPYQVASLLINNDVVTKQAGYLHLFYQWHDRFGTHAGVGYVTQENNNSNNPDQNFRNSKQWSYVAGLHFYINDNFMVKGEYHYFDGDYSSYTKPGNNPQSDGHLVIARGSYLF
ncbi:MAG: outer membrane beta-barrel protein [Fibrobacterales bacterium]